MPKLLSMVALVVIASSASAQPNFLLIIADDVGVDLIGTYDESSLRLTPEIDSLAAEGIFFRNAWSAPLCSATRASILTGRYGFRTGVGAVIPRLLSDELTLPQSLSNYGSYLAGKWHVTFGSPIDAGFAGFRGTPANTPDGEDFFWWTKTLETPDSTQVLPGHTVYATTDTVDDSIEWITHAEPPWLVITSLHAIHKPVSVPPDHLHTQQTVKDLYEPGEPSTDPAVTRAVLEAVDTEVGRLLEAVDLHSTTVVFVGDNGSLPISTDPVNQGSKGSILEGGINVPLIVAGAGVTAPAGSETASLAHVVDIFATLVDLAGISLSDLPTQQPVDGVSLRPILYDPQAIVRESVYTDGRFFLANMQDPAQHSVAVRNDRYKLIRTGCVYGRTFALIDLWSDPQESMNLWGAPEAREAQTMLSNELIAVTRSFGWCEQPACGFGAELALLLPPLMWMRRRRSPRQSTPPDPVRS